MLRMASRIVVEERLGWCALGASLVAWILAIVSVCTGGFRVYVLGIGLSARGPHRAAVIAAALCAMGLVLCRPARRRLVADLEHRSTRWFAGAAAAISLAVVSIGLLYGTKAAAGADAYGYV